MTRIKPHTPKYFALKFQFYLNPKGGFAAWCRRLGIELADPDFDPRLVDRERRAFRKFFIEGNALARTVSPEFDAVAHAQRYGEAVGEVLTFVRLHLAQMKPKRGKTEGKPADPAANGRSAESLVKALAACEELESRLRTGLAAASPRPMAFALETDEEETGQ